MQLNSANMRNECNNLQSYIRSQRDLPFGSKWYAKPAIIDRFNLHNFRVNHSFKMKDKYLVEYCDLRSYSDCDFLIAGKI